MNVPVRAPAAGPNRSLLAGEIERRRTFAIISHPDAGKTTLTEKLLLFGGAIQLAGHVKAKRNRRSTQSDWMAIERERGISVVTSVMTFEYGGRVFNLLDTPGHEDFSEDTYRTLSAVDSAVMVIDAAKGIEARTKKLFEVCRLRDIPILTFINKMDRESRDTFELLDEIEKTLALDTTPMTWPVGRGRSGSSGSRRRMPSTLRSTRVTPPALRCCVMARKTRPSPYSNFAFNIRSTRRESSGIAASRRESFAAPRFMPTASRGRMTRSAGTGSIQRKSCLILTRHRYSFRRISAVKPARNPDRPGAVHRWAACRRSGQRPPRPNRGRATRAVTPSSMSCT